ncbi:MAG: hypothetical protein LBE98_02275, partial [Puniceicoccales bacterium]|nr:hypothetical protein [Puniceicoccales bacterium]
MSVIVKTSSYAALFGAGYGSGNTFSNWTVGNFGAEASLTSTGSAYAYAALFGAGYGSGGTFSNWTVGNFG